MMDVMRRAQLYAGDVVFLDSTASCDIDSYTVSFMLVETEAGSVPIAVMITKGQTMREYETCFRTVREMMGDEGFGGNSAPDIFMTDDSDAERGDLKNVFADGCQYLLCTFNVKQAVGRWLNAKEHNISMDDRTRRKEWCLAFRDSRTRGTQTNNISETNIGRFKVVVLKGHRAYNVVDLVMKCSEEMNKYYKDKLLRFSHGRVSKTEYLYKDLLKRGEYIKKADIRQVGPNTFTVPSSTDIDVRYVVTIFHSVLSCSCLAGHLGNPCKHSVTVHMHIYPVSLRGDERYTIATIALGEENMSRKEFYTPLAVLQSSSINLVFPEDHNYVASTTMYPEFRDTADDVISHSHDPAEAVEVCSTPTVHASTTYINQEVINRFRQELEAAFKQRSMYFINSVMSSPSRHHFLQLIQKGNRFLNSSMTDGMLQYSLKICRQRKQRRIDVGQPSISRRRPGVSRGSKRLPAGRPRKETPSKKARRV